MSLSIVSVLLAQGLFSRTYIGTYDHYHIQSAYLTSSGGYVAVGYGQYEVDPFPDQIYVLFLDPMGNLTRARTYVGPSGTDVWALAPGVVPAVDGQGYVIWGQITEGDTTYGLVFEIDTTGDNILWAKKYTLQGDPAKYEEPKVLSLQISSDGNGYVLSGIEPVYRIAYPNGDTIYYDDLWVFKLDASGNPVWSILYGDSLYNDELAFRFNKGFAVCPNGDYAFAFHSINYNYHAGHINGILRIDSAGNMRWAKLYASRDTNNTGEPILEQVLPEPDGGLTLAGEYKETSWQSWQRDWVLIKLDSLGNITRVWNYHEPDGYMGTDEIYMKTTDGGYLAAGSAEYDMFGEHEIFLLKIGTSGAVQWARDFNKSDDYGQFSFGLLQTPSGDYVITGDIVLSSHPGYFNGLMLKIDSDGNYPDGCLVNKSAVPGQNIQFLTLPPDTTYRFRSRPVIVTPTSFIVDTPSLSVEDMCPEYLYSSTDEDSNPLPGDFRVMGKNLVFNAPGTQRVRLALYDASGRLVQLLYEGELTPGIHTFTPDLKVHGVYMAVLETSNKNMMVKFIR